MDYDFVWIFNGENSRFSGGVFDTLQKAETWIAKHKLSGVLTSYALNKGVYDWAIVAGLFEVKKESHTESKFIGGFTTTSQEHYHYEDGGRE